MNQQAFNNLKQGQVVYLAPGTGLPAVINMTGTMAIIAFRGDGYAITTQGRLLTHCDIGLMIDSPKYDAGVYHISAAARQLHETLQRGIESAYTGATIQERQ